MTNRKGSGCGSERPPRTGQKSWGIAGSRRIPPCGRCRAESQWKESRRPLCLLRARGPRVVPDTGDDVLESRAETHRNPYDMAVPEIADELAAGRALMPLGRRCRALRLMTSKRWGRRRHPLNCGLRLFAAVRRAEWCTSWIA
jgi:hypothetical protein